LTEKPRVQRRVQRVWFALVQALSYMIF
jgi:hypothetical protein